MVPKVTVLCMAYNQEQFIRNTLDGFVMQKTNFPFEVLVHDDASTDKTPEIIREYAEKYPGIIIPILSTENHFRAGRNILIEEFYPRIRGKYVANCDGDDWWTDETKLQRQVDFFDTNPGFSICSTCAKVVWADESRKAYIWPDKRILKRRSVQTIADMLEQNDIINSSVMYRWNFEPQNWPTANFIPGDWFLHLLHARHGKLKILSAPMVNYTRWNGGIWQDGRNPKFLINNAKELIRFYECIESEFGVDKSKDMGKVAASIISACVSENRNDVLNNLTESFPDLIKFISKLALSQHKEIECLNTKLKHRKQLWYYIGPVILTTMIILGLL